MYPIGDWLSPITGRGKVKKVTYVGLEISKNVFEVPGVNQHSKAALRKTLKRGKVTEIFCQPASSASKPATAFTIGHGPWPLGGMRWRRVRRWRSAPEYLSLPPGWVTLALGPEFASNVSCQHRERAESMAANLNTWRYENFSQLGDSTVSVFPFHHG